MWVNQIVFLIFTNFMCCICKVKQYVVNFWFLLVCWQLPSTFLPLFRSLRCSTSGNWISTSPSTGMACNAACLDSTAPSASCGNMSKTKKSKYWISSAFRRCWVMRIFTKRVIARVCWMKHRRWIIAHRLNLYTCIACKYSFGEVKSLFQHLYWFLKH